MMNEFGTSVSEFNINDYIWYIVGGVALFFVIVGFIADKSGLAKKTFSKDSKKSADKVVEPEQNTVAQNIGSDTFEVNQVVDEPIVVETPQMVAEENLNYENSEVNISENEIVTETTPEEQQSSEDEFVSVEQGAAIMTDENSDNQNDAADVWNENESNNEVVIDSFENSENVEMDDDAMFTLDSDDEVGTSNEVSDIAAEDAEDDWGMEFLSENDDIISSIETDLPSLDEIAENSEDDVWKF